MKLFRSLLIAPAALGLMSQLAVSATETNLDDISNYSDIETIDFTNSFDKVDSNEKELLAGGEGLVDGDSYGHSHDGGFSETTSLTGTAAFQIGGVDRGELTEAVTATYSYNLDLNTSFTGDDNLYVGIETGNASGVNFLTTDSVDGSNKLSVASMYYQFPVGAFDVAVGPLLDNDDLMPTTISTYSDKFFMSGYSLLKSNFWLYDYTGPGAAISRNFDNGINASGSIVSTGGATSSGVLTKEGIDVITLSAGYDGDNYGGGVVYVIGDDYCGLINAYISTGCSTLGVSSLIVDVVGVGGYWTPNEGKTTFSATTNFVTPDVKGIDTENISDIQIAIEQEFGPGVLSASWKSIPLYNVKSSTDFDQDTLGTYLEVYYTQPINDSLDLTYGIAMAEPDDSNGDSFTLYDYTAVGAQATFKF